MVPVSPTLVWRIGAHFVARSTSSSVMQNREAWRVGHRALQACVYRHLPKGNEKNGTRGEPLSRDRRGVTEGNSEKTLSSEDRETGALSQTSRPRHTMRWSTVIMYHQEDQARQDEAARGDQQAPKRSYVLPARAR